MDTLFYNADDYADRYSAQDTIRGPAEYLSDDGNKVDIE